MTARRRLLIRKKQGTKGRVVVRILKYLLILLSFSLLYILFQRNYWKSGEKLTVAFANVDGGVRVVIFDSENAQITDYLIPGQVETEVTRGLGRWKIKSIWNLGQEEPVGSGRLLTETLTKHAKMPVYVYSDSQGYGIVKGSMKYLIASVFSSYDTNMSIGDRVAIYFFALSVKNTKRVDVDLADTSFLDERTLIDGSSGFIFSQTPPASLLSTFADQEVTSQFPKFSIKDNTGKAGYSESISAFVEVLGGKVLSISKGESQSVGCLVSSRSRSLAKKISRLLNCEEGKALSEGSFDTEITIGSDFVEEY